MMSNTEQDDLQKYLEEKAEQEKKIEQQKESESLSEYEACVLRESSRVHELMAEAQREAGERLEND